MLYFIILYLSLLLFHTSSYYIDVECIPTATYINTYVTITTFFAKYFFPDEMTTGVIYRNIYLKRCAFGVAAFNRLGCNCILIAKNYR